MPFNNVADDDIQAEFGFVDMAVRNGGLSPEFKKKFPKGTFKAPKPQARLTRRSTSAPRRANARRRAPRRHAVQRAGAESGDSGGEGGGKPPRLRINNAALRSYAEASQ
jgi:hypothetical protein